MRQIGSIKCIEINRSENINPSAKRQEPLTVILFHGFGADAYDLQPLADVIVPEAPVDWLFPQGIETVSIGPGWTGRAWWPIHLDRPTDFSELTPPSLPKVREQVLKAIAQLKVPWSSIVLGGFSQGAMLATELYLHAEEAPAGLVILSGTLICKKEWSELAAKRAGKKFFISHGNKDQVLDIKGAQRLETVLTSAGMKGSLLTFNGAHEIPIEVIKKVNTYLEPIVKDQAKQQA